MYNLQEENDIYFQQDGAPPHYNHDVKAYFTHNMKE